MVARIDIYLAGRQVRRQGGHDPFFDANVREELVDGRGHLAVTNDEIEFLHHNTIYRWPTRQPLATSGGLPRRRERGGNQNPFSVLMTTGGPFLM